MYVCAARPRRRRDRRAAPPQHQPVGRFAARRVVQRRPPATEKQTNSTIVSASTLRTTCNVEARRRMSVCVAMTLAKNTCTALPARLFEDYDDVASLVSRLGVAVSLSDLVE